MKHVALIFQNAQPTDRVLYLHQSRSAHNTRLLNNFCPASLSGFVASLHVSLTRTLSSSLSAFDEGVRLLPVALSIASRVIFCSLRVKETDCLRAFPRWSLAIV